jgi:hypothetical protein
LDAFVKLEGLGGLGVRSIRPRNPLYERKNTMCFRPPSFDAMMKKCEKCGAFNPPEAVKCKKCGADLPEAGGDDAAAAAMNMAPKGPMAPKSPMAPKGPSAPKGPTAPKA